MYNMLVCVFWVVSDLNLLRMSWNPKDGICMLCVCCVRTGIFGRISRPSGQARIVFVGEFVGRAVQPTLPEGRLAGVAMMGTVRRPSE